MLPFYQYFPEIMWHVTGIWVYFANLKIELKMMHLNFYGVGRVENDQMSQFIMS